VGAISRGFCHDASTAGLINTTSAVYLGHVEAQRGFFSSKKTRFTRKHEVLGQNVTFFKKTPPRGNFIPIKNPP